VIWLPFELHPEYPPEGIPREQLLARYGPGMTDNVRRMFESRGLEYNPHPDVVPNSLRALQLSELARDLDRHGEAHDRIMDAYWAEARNIADPEVLRELAGALGLPADDVEEVLTTDRYVDRIRDSTQQAAALGVTGVPGFLLDRRLLVLGAQPEAVFEQAFAQLGEPAA
jgi:predicted DsbA family dithiol-disulfide isomerase